MKHKYTTIAKEAHVHDTAVIGTCCFIKGTVGPRCRIQTGCHVGETAVLTADVFLGPGCVVCDDKYPPSKGKHYRQVLIGPGAVIGANSTILPGVTIGALARIGAGSVVTRDIPANALAYGNPARVHTE